MSEVLRKNWVPGLQKVGVANGSLDSWLASGTYTWADASLGSVVLNVSTANDGLANAFASEISRFACATYESLLDATAAPHSTSALGWALIRYYYATFYAAHALLRISGKSLTMISPRTAQIMNKVGGQYLPISPGVGSALYLVEHHSAKNQLVLTKVGGSGGGSHEEMWERFLALLRTLENDIVLEFGNSKEAEAAIKEIELLRGNLCRNGKANGAWLSTVRNSLNYRHDYGVWFPCTFTAKSAAGLVAKMSNWKLGSDPFDGAKSSTELGPFVDSCNLTAQLLTCALSEILKRGPQYNASFVTRYPFRLLRTRKIKM